MRKTLTTEYEYNSPCRNTGVSCFFCADRRRWENDNRLEVLQLQGGYLYDKGENDELVPFGQSCMLYDKLVQCRKEATFYAIENAHHGGREFWSNQVLDIIEAFIKRDS